jgi:AraC family transcriptional regulator
MEGQAAQANDIIESTATGWRRSPDGVLHGSERTHVAAALWTDQGLHREETGAPADPERHVVAICLQSFHLRMFFDGVERYQKRVPPNSMMLVRAGERPGAIATGGWRVLHVYLPDRLIRELVDAEGLASRVDQVELLDPECGERSVVDRIAHELEREMDHGAPLSRLRMDVLGQDLAIELLRNHSDIGDTRLQRFRSVRGGLAPWQARRVCELLDDEIEREVPLAELSDEVGLSTYHLCRAFKQTMGAPPHQYQRQRRVERARELLASTDLPVTEIALRVGYQDPSQFARVFRKATNESPTAFRRRRRR